MLRHIFVIVAVAMAFIGQNLVSVSADAQAVEIKDEKIGKKAADKYFLKRKSKGRSASSNRAPAGASSEHYMALHLGGFLSDTAYRWGPDKAEDTGQFTFGVTYRMGEWVNSMDLLFRADFTSYDFARENPVKLSLLPMVVFPDATSEFPLYFGAGAGVGVFFKQIESESDLSFDYQLVAGARFFDLFDDIGLLFEFGLKNHILLTSDGQFNGVFGATGVLFNF